MTLEDNDCVTGHAITILYFLFLFYTVLLLTKNNYGSASDRSFGGVPEEGSVITGDDSSHAYCCP
jgi:hypothetical protein